MLYIVDDVTRECLAAIPDTSIARRRVAREVTALLERRGRETWHDRLRSWHGVHLGSHPCLIEGAQGRVALHRTEKADVRHGYVERCNGRMRDELLNESLFFGLSHASRAISKWSTTAIRSGRTRRSDTAPRQPILGSSPQPSQLVYRKRSRLSYVHLQAP